MCVVGVEGGSDLLGKEGRWLPVSLRELLSVTMASLQKTLHFLGFQTHWNELCPEREKMVFSKVGLGSEGGGGKKATANQESWVPRHKPRDQEPLPPPDSADQLCVARSRARWHLFKPFSLFEGQTHIKNQEVSGSK